MRGTYIRSTVPTEYSYIYTYIYTYIHTSIHAYIHLYIHTHTHTHQLVSAINSRVSIPWILKHISSEGSYQNVLLLNDSVL